MRSRGFAVALLLSCVACSKDSAPAPSAPTPVRAIRLGGNLDFGDVQIGVVRRDGVLVISNDGNAALSVTGITLPNGSAYVAGWTGGTIAPGGSQTVLIQFAPTAEQSYSGALSVSGDQTSGTNTINVTGAGTRRLALTGTWSGTLGYTSPINGPQSVVIPTATVSQSGTNLTITFTATDGSPLPYMTGTITGALSSEFIDASLNASLRFTIRGTFPCDGSATFTGSVAPSITIRAPFLAFDRCTGTFSSAMMTLTR